MECRECLENISALIDGELSGLMQERLEEHLLTCANCRETADQLQALGLGLVRAFENISVPDRLEERILFSLGQEKKRAKQQSILTALAIALILSPVILFSSLLWRFVHLLYSLGTIFGRLESTLLPFVPATTGWLIGLTACFLIIGGSLLVRAMLRGFKFNGVLS